MPQDVSEAIVELVRLQIAFDLWRGGADVDDQHGAVELDHRKRIAAATLAVDAALNRAIATRIDLVLQRV